MNENVMSQLDAELEHAGEEEALSPKMLLLEQLRITPEKQLKPMEFLFHLFGKPCFPRRELVAITGKAKSGKTFVTSMLMACCQAGDVLSFHRETDAPLRLLWYDTEQSDESTQDILRNRVMKLAADKHGQTRNSDLTAADKHGQARNSDLTATDKHGLTRTDLFDAENNTYNSLSKEEVRKSPCQSDAVFDVFNVRAVPWKERRDLLREAVTRCKPDLVIVDGIRDLVNDINDGVLAQEVMEELMHLATQHNCCIVCVLHQNKSGEDHNLRGWIGTELMNKAFEVYSCEKLLPQRIFSLEQTLTRKYDIERTMYFEVGDDGLPRQTAVPVEGSSDCKNNGRERLQPLNREYIITDEDSSWRFDTKRLFFDAFNGCEKLSGSDLRSRIMQLSGISVPFTYNRLLKEAVDGGHVIRSTEGHLTIYQPAPF